LEFSPKVRSFFLLHVPLFSVGQDFDFPSGLREPFSFFVLLPSILSPEDVKALKIAATPISNSFGFLPLFLRCRDPHLLSPLFPSFFPSGGWLRKRSRVVFCGPLFLFFWLCSSKDDPLSWFHSFFLHLCNGVFAPPPLLKVQGICPSCEVPRYPAPPPSPPIISLYLLSLIEIFVLSVFFASEDPLL